MKPRCVVNIICVRLIQALLNKRRSSVIVLFECVCHDIFLLRHVSTRPGNITKHFRRSVSVSHLQYTPSLHVPHAAPVLLLISLIALN